MTGGVKDNAVGQGKFEFMGKASRANGEVVIQFHAKALPHETHSSQGIALVSLLQNAFEHFKKTEARHDELCGVLNRRGEEIGVLAVGKIFQPATGILDIYTLSSSRGTSVAMP